MDFSDEVGLCFLWKKYGLRVLVEILTEHAALTSAECLIDHVNTLVAEEGRIFAGLKAAFEAEGVASDPAVVAAEVAEDR